MHKNKEKRVLHHLLENPIFLERMAILYEKLSNSHKSIAMRIQYFYNIRNGYLIPGKTCMERICEAYRFEKTRTSGIADERDILDISSELLAIYNHNQ